MGKSTISMAIFNSYVKLPEGNLHESLTTDFLPESGEINHFLSSFGVSRN